MKSTTLQPTKEWPLVVKALNLGGHNGELFKAREDGAFFVIWYEGKQQRWYKTRFEVVDTYREENPLYEY